MSGWACTGGSATGSTSGTGVRPNGAHDSTFANEGTTDDYLAYMLSFEGPVDNLAERSANSHAGIGLQLSLTPAGATQQNGVFCSSEGGMCNFNGTQEVIFGCPGFLDVRCLHRLGTL